MRNDLVVQAVHIADMRVDLQIRDQTVAIDYPIQPGGAGRRRLWSRWIPVWLVFYSRVG